MDYGDGKINGKYQFNTKYRKSEICEEIQTNAVSCEFFREQGPTLHPTTAMPTTSSPSPHPSPPTMRPTTSSPTTSSPSSAAPTTTEMPTTASPTRTLVDRCSAIPRSRGCGRNYQCGRLRCNANALCKYNWTKKRCDVRKPPTPAPTKPLSQICLDRTKRCGSKRNRNSCKQLRCNARGKDEKRLCLFDSRTKKCVVRPTSVPTAFPTTTASPTTNSAAPTTASAPSAAPTITDKQKETCKSLESRIAWVLKKACAANSRCRPRKVGRRWRCEVKPTPAPTTGAPATKSPSTPLYLKRMGICASMTYNNKHASFAKVNGKTRRRCKDAVFPLWKCSSRMVDRKLICEYVEVM